MASLKTFNPVKSAKELGETGVGKVAKGALSFTLGPAILFTALIVGAATKTAAEISNASLSTWVKSFNTGMTSLFSNNPFLAFLSSSADNLMQSSWNFSTYLYTSGIEAMAQQFEEFANHDGFGSTGISGEKNDWRDNEALDKNRKEIAKKRLEQERKKFADSLKEYQNQNPLQNSEAIKELEKWIKRGNDLNEKINEMERPNTEEDAKKILEMTSDYFKNFEEALKNNPKLKLVFDLTNQASTEAFARIQKRKEEGEEVSIEDWNITLRKILEESGLKELSNNSPRQPLNADELSARNQERTERTN